ncbi:hypothetical protein MAR_004985 [Mya arenaria]|uniref:Uncharacterized protein n=1 Tax=Mya arenaria TaxID=6604 RepID=A0ABY7EYB8_MYAAR|nr:hypothetical protein MAR_004985 [Mya arenaria]
MSAGNRWKTISLASKVKMGKKVEKGGNKDKNPSATNQDEVDSNRALEPYVCTGNFTADFTELCRRANLAYTPPVVPRPKPPAPVTQQEASPDAKGGKDEKEEKHDKTKGKKDKEEKPAAKKASIAADSKKKGGKPAKGQGNPIGESGLEALLKAMQYQATLTLDSHGGTGLMRLLVGRSRRSEHSFSRMTLQREHDVMQKINDLMTPKDPFYKPPPQTPDVES